MLSVIERCRVLLSSKPLARKIDNATNVITLQMNHNVIGLSNAQVVRAVFGLGSVPNLFLCLLISASNIDTWFVGYIKNI